VTDTGCGMDTGTLSKLFEPFFTTKEQGKGTGLGLSIVYGIVKQSGGHIFVESQNGRGTTFTVYLPSTQEPLETDAVASQHGVPVQRCSLPLNKAPETILVVEDEDIVRRVVCHTLQAAGYHILLAQNGDEASEICRTYEGTIHLLLSDVVMPGACGPDIACETLRVRPHCKIILMSGYSDNPVVQKGSWKSDWTFLQKPVLPSVLVQAVRQRLDETNGELTPPSGGRVFEG
jgi:two-component system cell cycle sensor histidine kinase/response regulator CckA